MNLQLVVAVRDLLVSALAEFAELFAFLVLQGSRLQTRAVAWLPVAPSKAPPAIPAAGGSGCP